MPSYQLTPFKATPKLLTPGIPAFFWGSFNDKTGPTTGNIVSISANGTSLLYVVRIMSGNIPIAGSLFTVVGTASATYDLTNSVITAVSSPANPDEGIYTISVASLASFSSIQDSGQFMIPQPEVGEALAAGASAPLVMPYNIMNANLNQAVTVVASFPSLPTSVVLSLQQALQDLDSEYATVAVIATVAGGAVTTGPQITVDPTLGRFFRVLNGTVIGGTLPTVICKIMI
jgi:hypothetical protein